MKIAEISRDVTEFEAFDDGVEVRGAAVQSIDDAYHMNHRGGDIGYYAVERRDECAYEVTW